MIKRGPMRFRDQAIQRAQGINGHKLMLGHGESYRTAAGASSSKAFLMRHDIWNKKVAELKAQKMSNNQIKRHMFNTMNKVTLDRAIQRNARIVMSTPPGGIRKGSFLEMEVSYLQRKGYKFTPDGLEMVPKRPR